MLRWPFPMPMIARETQCMSRGRGTYGQRSDGVDTQLVSLVVTHDCGVVSCRTIAPQGQESLFSSGVGDAKVTGKVTSSGALLPHQNIPLVVVGSAIELRLAL